MKHTTHATLPTIREYLRPAIVNGLTCTAIVGLSGGAGSGNTAHSSGTQPARTTTIWDQFAQFDLPGVESGARDADEGSDIEEVFVVEVAPRSIRRITIDIVRRARYEHDPVLPDDV